MFHAHLSAQIGHRLFRWTQEPERAQWNGSRMCIIDVPYVRGSAKIQGPNARADIPRMTIAEVVIAAATGLGGAAVGGGITFVINRQNLRSQKDAREDKYRRARVKEGRADFITFLTRLEIYIDWVRELEGRLALPKDTERRQDLLEGAYSQYLSAWSRFIAAAAAVRVTSPEFLVQEVNIVVKKVGFYSDLVETKRLGGRWASGTDEARQDAKAAIAHCASRAQSVYGLCDSDLSMGRTATVDMAAIAKSAVA